MPSPVLIFYMTGMKKYFILFSAVAALLLLCALIVKLRYSERFRIAWNHTRYFYDGRHTLKGEPRAVIFDLDGELWVRDKHSGSFMRFVPGSGIELSGEQNLSMSSSREGERVMYKLRPQWASDAAHDHSPPLQELPTNGYYLYFEQRLYSNDTVISYYKDAAYGPGGLFFTEPESGQHIAQSNYSTVYVPVPEKESFAGPSNWLWAAAANKRYVDNAVTGSNAQSAWDTRYMRVTAVPESRFSPGNPGDCAVNQKYLYLYQSSSTGWLRISADTGWQ